MTEASSNPASPIYRRLPSIDELARAQELQPLLDAFPRSAVIAAIRAALQSMRSRIGSGELRDRGFESELVDLYQSIRNHVHSARQSSLIPVLNATGVLLHTNLGRAPLSANALENVVRVSRGYCNLEVSLATGERSKRDYHVEKLVLRLLAQRAGLPLEQFLHNYRAVVVNNCAAATFLVLNSLSCGHETIVSRGELLEIGGGFRIPDILVKSGAVLREVGTTNRTRASDYAKAITADTALLLRVHAANFTMTGFVEAPTTKELVALCHAQNKILFEDQGTGCLIPLEDYGVAGEDTFIQSVRAGVPIIACSGDKLLGGPQCGLVVGLAPLIDRLLENPLLRILRVDKMIYAALETTLQEYIDHETPDLPLARMLQQTLAQLESRAERIKDSLRNTGVAVRLQPENSLIGGGTTPGATLESVLIVLDHATVGPAALSSALRALELPVIPRTLKGSVALDLRTIPPESDDLLIEQLNFLFSNSSTDQFKRLTPS